MKPVMKQNAARMPVALAGSTSESRCFDNDERRVGGSPGRSSVSVSDSDTERA